MLTHITVVTVDECLPSSIIDQDNREQRIVLVEWHIVEQGVGILHHRVIEGLIGVGVNANLHGTFLIHDAVAHRSDETRHLVLVAQLLEQLVDILLVSSCIGFGETQETIAAHNLLVRQGKFAEQGLAIVDHGEILHTGQRLLVVTQRSDVSARHFRLFVGCDGSHL